MLSSSPSPHSTGPYRKLPSARVSVRSPEESLQQLLSSREKEYITLQKPSGVGVNCTNYEGVDTRTDPVAHVTVKDYDPGVHKVGQLNH